MSESQLTHDDYEYFDADLSVPVECIVLADLPAHPDQLRAAGVAFDQVLHDYAAYGRAWRIDENWAIKLAARAQLMAEHQAVPKGHEAERRQSETAAEARRKAERSAAAKRAARTRREKKVLSATPYGRLLLALREAHAWNATAKSRAANGVRFHDYWDNSRYPRANYRRSRQTRANDYFRKWLALQTACGEAQDCSIAWGWSEDPLVAEAPHVVYFDLPTGQVSFHDSDRGVGPDYAGEWDGVRDVAWGRIEAAIELVMAAAKAS